MSDRAEGFYWTQWGTNPRWDVMYWREGYFWDSADCGYTEEKFTVGPRISAPDEVTHRHKKRGSEYVLIGIGKMQAENWVDETQWSGEGDEGTTFKGIDMREVAICRSVDDGSFWARPREEFEDGRFEALAAEAGGTKPS